VADLVLRLQQHPQQAANTFSGTTGMSAAQIGSEMFGVAYGMGGEISPGFAIGGRGSFTSFAHYGAGISQADEISIVSNAAPGVFATPESGKDAIDGLVAGGYTESEITAIAQTGQYAGLIMQKVAKMMVHLSQ
jgi:hypothetical protein